MDIEDLNKSQLIILTLLTSFVTSIATGILTVYLLQQVPTPITQTINRVVQQTVEKVVPGPSTKEVKIVIREDETIPAIAASEKDRVVRLLPAGTSASTTVAAREYSGIGFLIPSESVVFVDGGLVGEVGSRAVSVELADRVIVPAEVIYQGNSGAAVLKVILPADYKKDTQDVFADPKAINLGQKVFVISGISAFRLTVGNITEVNVNTERSVVSLKTDIVLRESDSGAPIFSTDGSIVGLALVLHGRTEIITGDVLQAAIKGKETSASSARKTESGTAAVGVTVPAASN